MLFVDDGRDEEVFRMGLGEGRGQAGEIRAVKFGVSVVDLEGITHDGKRFDVVGHRLRHERLRGGE